MRILTLSQFYPPIIGGEEQHVRTLSIELAARGHHVAVVTLWQQGLPEFELDCGVRVYRVRSSMQRIPWLSSNNRRQFAPPFPDPEITLALRRITARERPEIVHAHNWLVYSFLPLKAWSGARLVVTLHNYNLVCAKLTLANRTAPCSGPGLTKCLGCATQHYGLAKGVPVVLVNRVMSQMERDTVDMFLPVSQAAATGNGLVGSRHPFRVVPNFMPNDTNTLHGDVDSYLAQLPSEDYLLFVGALGHLKGIDVLLRAYGSLKNAPPLVLIGYKTPSWSRLSVDIPRNVFVLTDWPHYAVMAAWRRSIIALLPSLAPETFGLVVMEAMASGRPVIASRIGALTDLVVDGETGFLVQPGDPLTLQQAIEQLLANPNLRSRMGQAALRKVSAFKASAILPRIEQVYQEVLQQQIHPSMVVDDLSTGVQ